MSQTNLRLRQNYNENEIPEQNVTFAKLLEVFLAQFANSFVNHGLHLFRDQFSETLFDDRMVFLSLLVLRTGACLQGYQHVCNVSFANEIR